MGGFLFLYSKYNYARFLEDMNKLTLFQRIRVVIIALFFLGTKRRDDFKCSQYVNKIYRLARIPVWSHFKNINPDQKNNPPFGEAIFLLEKGIRSKRWSHVAIALPFGFVIHLSYYWGEKVVITNLQKIWERYDLAT